jgi:hypothetical protein
MNNIQSFYEMSERDAATAVGQIIGDDCPQFKPNINAVTRTLGDS